MPNGLSSKYFAALPSKDTAQEIESRTSEWGKSAISNSYLDKTRRSWQYYHGAYYERGTDHRISFSGDQGELVQFPVNHYRNIGLHLLNMTVANRPALQARSSNTDYKSLSQTILANGLLDYYMREKSLEDYLEKAAEYAIVFGEGYVKLEWDANSGQVYDYEENEETGTKIPIYEGDIRYTNLSVYDVIRDSTKESTDHDWLCVRSYKNRFALAAKYPELADEILKVESKDDLDKIKFPIYGPSKTDDIAVYEFYHVRNDALPDGRYMLYVSPEAILYDGPLPYEEIPVYRISASEFLGTPYGYTILFDLMPIQEAINMLYGVIITNQNAFGVQNILVPKGADLNLSQLTGGLNILEFNALNQAKPEALNLTQTPAEIFKMVDKLENTMETISGINSVTRGNPESSLKSGAALALVQAQAVQFASNLQQSYVRLVENVGTATIKILQWYAKVPRVATIVGKANRAYTKEFQGNDLSKISRVVVEMANPLSKTTAGRLEIANQLLQMSLIKSPEQYFTVLNTGSLDTMIEGKQAELLLIRAENERMMDGIQPQAVAFDIHQIHIEEHKSLLADPDLRSDPDLVGVVLAHIQEHINLLRTADPGILAVTGQQPLPPPPPPPGSQPPGPPQGMPPGPPQGPPQGLMQSPPHPGPGAPMKPGNPSAAARTEASMQHMAAPLPVDSDGKETHLPNLPHPPKPFQALPTNPAQTAPK